MQSCSRPDPGERLSEPADLRSQNGELKVDLTVLDSLAADGSTRYCYVDANGNGAPTLRVKPGDLITLTLKNKLNDIDRRSTLKRGAEGMAHHHQALSCSAGPMNQTSTNLHFHGLNIPSTCHQDDVLNTLVAPQSAPFQYTFRIPDNQPPGLYWYHPHVHGFTATQILGGASGALIVEGIERVNPQLAGLPERVLVIRDQDLLKPDALPAQSEPVLPKMLIDRDGDAANNGTGFGKPAKDLSVNYVPVPYPDYAPALLEMKPEERQLWRVLNASAITYLDLAVILNRTPQALQLVGLDGAPVNQNGVIPESGISVKHIGVPPGSRVEFVATAPPLGAPALLVTRTVDTGPGGENDPNRALVRIDATVNAPEPRSRLDESPKPMPASSLPWLGSVSPVVTRRLYFSEKLQDPNNPTSAVEFYLTVDGQTPKPFDPSTGIPNIIAKEGTVEDWIIENRTQELHDFHIHQLHFMLLDYMGKPLNEPFLRDTVNVPYFTDRALSYPSVRIRLDFRDPNAVGTYIYHCHLLEHEDGGMMGLIRVDAADHKQ